MMHNIRVMRDDKKPILNVVTPPWGSLRHSFDDACNRADRIDAVRGSRIEKDVDVAGTRVDVTLR